MLVYAAAVHEAHHDLGVLVRWPAARLFIDILHPRMKVAAILSLPHPALLTGPVRCACLLETGGTVEAARLSDSALPVARQSV